MKKIFGSILKKSPQPTFQDQSLGKLIYDSELWTGKLKNDVYFFVAGNPERPDPLLLNSLKDLLKKFDKINLNALSYIKKQLEPHQEIDINDFTNYAVDFIWDDHPELFALEYTMKDDLDGIWRVEFKNGNPVSIGRDD